MDLEMGVSNKIELCGKVLTKPIYTHELYGEGFYEFFLGVDRLSEYEDKIPITISEKILNENVFNVGDKVTIKGQLRSYNKLCEGKSKLILTVFAREAFLDDSAEPKNNIEIYGYICKEPIYRTTPFNREICDVLLAVNRAYNKSDYLPCIAWGRNARFIKDAKVGESVAISGRVQSREYQKKLEDGTVETRTAYEISIGSVSIESSNLDVLKQCEIENENQNISKA